MLSSRKVFATIPASDLGRAKDWYRDKLGLTPTDENPAGVAYDLDNGTGFRLYPTSNAGKAPNTLMSFSSTDVPGDVAALKGRGVVFEEYDMPGLKTENGIAALGPFLVGWFKDSEGNILAIGND